LSKSGLLCCGTATAPPQLPQVCLIDSPFKFLGVYLGEEEQLAAERSWSAVAKKITNTLNLWRMRALGHKGRVVVANTLAVTKLYHTLHVHAAPRSVLTALNHSFNNFIWKGKRIMVSHTTLIGSKKNGGLNLVDIDSKRMAFRLHLLTKLFNNPDLHLWHEALGRSRLSCRRHGMFNLCQILPSTSLRHLDPFWAEVMVAWQAFRPGLRNTIHHPGQILREPLFHNPELHQAGKPFRCAALQRGGVDTVGDIFGDIFDRHGRMDLVSIENNLRKKNIIHRKEVVRRVCAHLAENVPPDWLPVLGSVALSSRIASVPTFVCNILFL